MTTENSFQELGCDEERDGVGWKLYAQGSGLSNKTAYWAQWRADGKQPREAAATGQEVDASPRGRKGLHVPQVGKG